MQYHNMQYKKQMQTILLLTDLLKFLIEKGHSPNFQIDPNELLQIPLKNIRFHGTYFKIDC
jgi:hypothetical protein